jgi:signal transduction histidine kinase
MLSTEAQAQIGDILELLAQLKNTPIAIFQKDLSGKTHQVASSDLDQYPQHCQAVWKLDGGKGEEACKANTCGRAALILQAAQAQSLMCHAGLTAEAVTISVDDEPMAVLKYGAYVTADESSAEQEKRLAHHHEAMARLNATLEEAEQIKALLLDEKTQRTAAYLNTLRTNLPPLVQRILGKYLIQYENERMAYHDLQLRLQAAVSDAYNLNESLTESLPKDSDLQEEVESILGSVMAMRMVMHNLTKGEYLSPEYRFKPHNVLDLINESVSLVRSQAKIKKLDLVVNVTPPNKGLQIPTSRSHLQEAFNNIIQNAIKYSYHTSSNYEHQSEKRRFVRIQGRQVDNSYRVVISNFGIGIERDEFDKVFLEGYKGRLTKTERRGGVGHGLALAKRIIEKHQGTVSAFSELVNKPNSDGTYPYQTQFIISLPLKYYGPNS